MIKGRIMAVDFGTKRIGIAISDEMQILASARGVIVNDPMSIRELVARAKAEGVIKVVLGLPRSLKNEDSDMTRQVRSFGEKLQVQLEAASIEFEFRDERLTSVMANANIAMSGLGKKKREEKSLRDEEAARILLQTYLDQYTG
ncbi:MAG TPA: Holliday junction resolvase RuvX [Candidatus Kapabacteria bacterium]|nr:Holliday junction resolvase RuvX [Candidatus Kapabacteria bacterium]